ncbi:M16 family metallopeptidase [Erythrobacter sp. R86502]|uniref:M16 family metallopeptidase n=1 Tax=Erythrobacter sp. R86502 TaxID=3093846 RepID=UPI0036D3CE5C
MGRRMFGSLRTASWLAMAAGLALALPSAAAAQDTTGQSATAPTSQTGGVPAWGIASTDFPADPDITFGRLPNGMRYAIKRHANPPGEAAVRFNISAGYREEADDELGAAHFVEHMAFNGSTNIPEGQLLPMLERLGLAFGADTNAETSVDYTTYKLSLPRTNDETVDTALKVIREMAGELTFDPAAVDRERGIMLSEAQVRNDPNRRRGASYFQAALPGSRIGDRIAASEERIRNISADQLQTFYKGYYRPYRATLVIVGDFDVAAMQDKIEAVFGDWQAEGPARDIYDGPVNVATDAPAIGTFVDPAIPEIIELQRVSRWTPPANSVAASRDDVLRAVAAAALTNRVNALVRKPDAPILFGQMADQPLYRSARSFGLVAVAKDGQWDEALALAENELRRADQFGFTAAEIAESKANIATALANAVAQADGRPNAAIAESLIVASLQNSVPTAPALDLAFYQAIEPTLTPEAVSEAFRAAWQGGPTLVHVSTKQSIAGGSQQIAAALEQSAAVAVTAPVEAAAAQWAYGEWGTPGTVVDDTTIADLGIRTVRFANGLQLNLKVTNFAPGKLSFAMRIGSGFSQFPKDREGLRELLPVAASIDGLEAHDIDELRRVLAGKAVGLGLEGEANALVAKGQTTSADLKLQLDLLAARLTATGWRPETAAQLAGAGPVIVQQIKANPAGLLLSSIGAVMAGDDARFGFTSAEALAQVTLDDLRAQVQPQLAEGSLALGLVGDFDPDAAIAAVAQTLGALPTRAIRTETIDAAEPVAFATDRSVRTLTHIGGADQGAIALSWPTTDGTDLRDDLTRDLLASVMSLQLTETLREELGTTYSPEAFSYSGTDVKGFGYLAAFATVPPEAMDATAAAMKAIAGRLAQTPPTDDLMERARNPVRAAFQRAETQNAAWLDLVSNAQSDASVLDRRRQRLDLLNAITAADLQAAAQRYLAGGTPVEIRAVPEAR